MENNEERDDLQFSSKNENKFANSAEKPFLHRTGSSVSVSVSAKSNVTTEPVIVLYMLAHTATHQVLEQLIYSVISEHHGVQSIVRLDQDKIHCSSDHNDPQTSTRMLIQSDASYWLTYMRISVCVPSIVAAFVWGNISDRLPRKLPILLPLIANMLLIVLAIGVVLFRLPVAVILVGYFLEGLGGSTSTFLMGCYAYLANISTNDSRTSRINVNEICIRLAHSAASFILGQMLKSLGFFLPFLVILSLYIASVLYTVQILPAVSNTSLNYKKTNSWSAMYSIFTKKRSDNGRVKIVFVGVIYFLVALASISRSSVNMLFLQNEPFCWNAKNVGMFFSADSLLQSSWNIFVLVYVHKRLGDVRVLLISLGSAVFYMTITALSASGTALYFSLLFAMPHHVAFTVMRAIMSKLVAPNEQGAVFSSIAFAELIVALFGTLAYNVIYAKTVGIFRGFVFMLSANIYLAAFAITLILYFRVRM